MKKYRILYLLPVLAATILAGCRNRVPVESTMTEPYTTQSVLPETNATVASTSPATMPHPTQTLPPQTPETSPETDTGNDHTGTPDENPPEGRIRRTIPDMR